MPYYYRDGVELYYNKHDGSWRIDRTQYARNYGEMNVTSVYGTSRANAELKVNDEIAKFANESGV